MIDRPLARLPRYLLLAGALLCAVPLAHAGKATQSGWPFWGGDGDNSRSAPGETALNPATVPGLQVQWTYTTGGDISATPTVEGNDLYITDWGGYVHKIDRRTGKGIWKHKLSEFTGKLLSMSRNSPAIGRSVVVIGDRKSGRLMALDKTTGALVWKVMTDTDPTAIVSGSPVIQGGRVLVGISSEEELAVAPLSPLNFRGSVLALDVATGAEVWRFRAVPEGYSGGAVWSSSPVPDLQRGSLYVTTGNNTSLPKPVAACIAAADSPAAQVACLPDDDYFDALLALDLQTGALKWARRLTNGADAWIAACLAKLPACQVKGSQDYDFGSGANLIRTVIDGQPRQLVGAGQKSGMYWAVDPDDGSTVWSRQVGPGGFLGGIMWGSATDGSRVYVAVSNSTHQRFLLAGDSSRPWSAGSWAALDARNGTFDWQVPQIGGGPLTKLRNSAISSSLSVANGVLYTGSQDGTMAALDAANGNVLWTFDSGGTVMSGPSIVDGTLYWGSGYQHTGGTGSRKLYAFAVPSAISARQ